MEDSGNSTHEGGDFGSLWPPRLGRGVGGEDDDLGSPGNEAAFDRRSLSPVVGEPQDGVVAALPVEVVEEGDFLAVVVVEPEGFFGEADGYLVETVSVILTERRNPVGFAAISRPVEYNDFPLDGIELRLVEEGSKALGVLEVP